jgi:hypothetical protein
MIGVLLLRANNQIGRANPLGLVGTSAPRSPDVGRPSPLSPREKRAEVNGGP